MQVRCGAVQHRQLGDPTTMRLRDWLIQQLVRDHPFPDNRDHTGKRSAEVLVENYRILPVLDGFDELPERHHREAIGEISRVPGPLVVTSRPDEYASAARAARALGKAAAIELDDLTLDETRRYLQASTGRTCAAEWDAVFGHLDTAPDETASRNLTPVLTTPLMVVLARTTYNDAPGHTPRELLDTHRFPTREDLEEHLLGAYLVTLYDPRRSTRGAAQPNWSAEQAQHWLGHLATHLTKLNTHDLTWWQLPSTLHRHTRILLITSVLGFVNVVVSALGDDHAPRDTISPWQLLATDRTVTLARTTASAVPVMIVLWLLGGHQAGLGFGFLVGIPRLALSAWGPGCCSRACGSR